MSKINEKGKDGRFGTERLAGGMGPLGAKQSPLNQLRRSTLACLLWEDMFYINGADATQNIRELVPQCNPQDVLDLAVEARVMQKLRHIPLFLVVLVVRQGHTEGVAEAIAQICTRVDMVTDLIALYGKENGKIKPLPKCIQKGISAAMNTFDAYSIGKYNRKNAVKLKDVLKLCHPTGKDQAQKDLFKQIIDDTVPTPDTWEVAYSAAKDTHEKKGVWERLMGTSRLPALAFLRNLSNMTKTGVPASMIRKYFASVNSKMLLPLNFYAAYKATPEFSRDIEAMMARNYDSIEKLPGETLMIVDTSGSMGAGVSGKSGFSRLEVAKVLTMFALEQCESCRIVVTAGRDAIGKHTSTEIKYPSRGFGLMQQIDKAKAEVGGGGIFTRQCLEWCNQNDIKGFDRVIVFSDSQDCDPRDKVPNPSLVAKRGYIVDVSAHKNGVNYKGVWDAEVSGWSERYISYIAAMEGVSNGFEQE